MTINPVHFETGDAAEEAGDFPGARRAFEQGAQLGDPICWQRLGLMFDLGIGVQVNKKEAMRCYRQAWRQRDLASARNIAVLYEEVGKNRAMFSWLRRAAQGGDGGAYLELAKCYRDGVGVRRSTDAVLRCLAAAIGSPHIAEFEREEAQEIMDAFRPRPI